MLEASAWIHPLRNAKLNQHADIIAHKLAFGKQLF